MMAPQIFEVAERANALACAVKKVRAEITIHLRDIARMIDLAYEEGRTSQSTTFWIDLQGRLKALSGRVSKTAPLDELKVRCACLARLRAEVEKAYLDSLAEEELQAHECTSDLVDEVSNASEQQNMSANDSIYERHIHNSKTEYKFENSINNKEKPNLNAKNEGSDSSINTISLVKLRMICPDFTDYSRNGLSDWSDALAAGAVVRSMLGISSDAWEKAARTMGQGAAIAVLAYIVQRGAEIRSAGGYLRSLTEKAEAGAFSIKPMMDSLVVRE